LDGNLSRHFQRKDAVKSKRQLLQKTKEYKAGRSKNRYVKYAEAHVSQLEEMKTGVMYQTGVAVKAAKKSFQKTALPRNPAGTLLKDWKCPCYHKKNCFTTGHKDCRSENCSMRGKTKDMRDAAVKEIAAEAIAIEVEKIASEGKNCRQSYYIFF